MKKITYSVAFVATLLASSNTFAQQGFGTNTPHRSAAVEIKSTNKGLLIPRIALTSATQKLNTSVNNANSLLVYNDGTTLPKGYYYWDENYVVTSAIIGNGTEENPDTPAVLGKWVAFSTVGGSNALGAENALTLNTITNKVELGGDLYRNTAINFNGNTFTLNASAEDSRFNVLGLSEIVSSAPGIRPSMNLMVNSTQAGEEGQVFTYTPSRLLEDYLIGKNGVKVERDELNNLAEVKLGGALTEDTTINTAGNKLVIKTGSATDATPGIRMEGTGLYVDNIQGWHQMANNTADKMVVAVGHMDNNQMSAATPTQVVNAGLVVNQTEITNNQQVLTINGNDYTTNYNQLVLTGDVTGTLNTTTVTKIQGVNVNQTPPQTNASEGEVLGIGTDGKWTRMSAGDIVSTGVNANNGLTKDGNLIQLGGALTKPTVIRTNVTETTVGEYTETSANTLAIDGLQNASTGNKRILIERVGEGANAHDVLRTVERAITVESTTAPANPGNYEEITYVVSTGGNLNLPTATAKGQIINIIIKQNLTDLLFINGDGEALVSADLTSAGITGASTNTLAYGEMLGQRWTLKSDGSKWIITARM